MSVRALVALVDVLDDLAAQRIPTHALPPVLVIDDIQRIDSSVGGAECWVGYLADLGKFDARYEYRDTHKPVAITSTAEPIVWW